MDKKIILVKTGKGEDEVKNKTNCLRASLDEMLQELLDGEFVQDKDKVSSGVDRVSSAIKMATSKMFAPKMSTPPRLSLLPR